MARGCLDDRELGLLAQNGLPPALASEATSHADSCPSCRERLARRAAGDATAATRGLTPGFVAPDPELPHPISLPRGTQVGRFLIIEPLGEGGMGLVYAAFDSELDRRVALKFLRAGESGSTDTGGATRLQREAQAMARLSHPNVVPIYDVGTFQQHVFLAMELVDGTTLKEWLKAEPRPSWKEIVRVFADAGRGLVAAHEAGIVHRDFKPPNVLIGKDGRVRVTDFGLARAPGTSGDPAPGAAPFGAAADSSDLTPLSSPLTRAGVLLGTPGYAAPEQVFSDAFDARTDQFSFCVSLYEALYGQRPFGGTDFIRYSAQLKTHVISPPPPDSGVPAWLRRVLLKGLSATPEDRFPSMEALLGALSKDPSAARRGWLLAAGALLVAAAASGWVLRAGRLRQHACDGWAEHLAGVWDPSVKKAVRDAFLATGLDYAKSTFETVERELDARADAWLAQQTQSCRATLVQHIQSDEVYFLQTRCLATRLEELRVLGELLTKADPGVVRKAASAATSLPALKACADVHALQGERRGSEDPKVLARLDELTKAFVRATALDDLGRFKDAQALGEQLAADAQAVGDELLRARGDWIAGRAALHLGDYKTGEAHLMSSVWIAEAAAADLVAARSISNLAGAEAFQGNFAPSHLWVNLGRALLKRGGGDDDIEALLDNNAGVLATNEGAFAESLKLYTDASEAARRSHAGSSMEATALTNIAVAHFSLGHVEEAASTVGKAVDMMEKSGGASHPQMVLPLVDLAEFSAAAGDVAGAEASAHRAIAVSEATLGKEHAFTGVAFATLAAIERRNGERRPAQQHALAAEPILNKGFGPQHDMTLWNELTLAELMLDDGHAAAALQAFQKDLAGEEKALGATHGDLGRALLGIGEAYLALAKPELAVPPLERALSIQRQSNTAKYDGHAIEFALARALVGSGGEHARALELARSARDGYQRERARQAEEARVVEWLKGAR